MRGELAVTLLVILGLPHGLQKETENVNQIQETREQKTQEQHCPTWFIPRSNHTGDCMCGAQTLEEVKCCEHSNQSMVRLGSCLTYNYSTDVQVVGGCPYNSHSPDSDEVYVKLPRNISLLNEFMCGGLNRGGVLCSHCKEGLGIPVFSYTLHCLSCLESLGGWLLYIFLAVFPTTIFFLILIIFKIRVTSAPMNAFIFACQVLSILAGSQPYIFNISLFAHVMTIVVSIFYGFWNLDFFRYVIPSFCVSEQLTPIQVLALEYIIAVYPLFLIASTYIGVELYARDCRLIVWLWKPFRRCLAFVLKRTELNFSLVHAFSSFLLLSYSKILFVSYQLLIPANLYDPKGQVVGQTMVYYDASIGYFGSTHLPFALLAIFVLCVFVVLPALVLLLYPTRAFQRSLCCCRVRWHALHAFADTFNGYYKNGTEGTRDYRYFAGLYFMFRILPLLIVLESIQFVWMVVIVPCAIISLLFALLRPYKDNWINIWDSVVFGLFSFSFFWVMYAEHVASLPIEVLGVIGVLPLIYIVVFVVRKYRNSFRNCCAFLNRYRANSPFEPDRLLNPEECGQLLPCADCAEGEHSTPGSRDETLAA